MSTYTESFHSLACCLDKRQFLYVIGLLQVNSLWCRCIRLSEACSAQWHYTKKPKSWWEPWLLQKVDVGLVQCWRSDSVEKTGRHKDRATISHRLCEECVGCFHGPIGIVSPLFTDHSLLLDFFFSNPNWTGRQSITGHPHLRPCETHISLGWGSQKEQAGDMQTPHKGPKPGNRVQRLYHCTTMSAIS